MSNTPLVNFGHQNAAMNDDFMFNVLTQMEQTVQDIQQTELNSVFNGNIVLGRLLGGLILGGSAGAGLGYFLANPLKGKKFKNSFTEILCNNADDVNKYAKYFDTNTRKFTKEAHTLNKALKSFKWKQAGKWGIIAAGTALFLDRIFYGKNQNAQA